MTHATEHEFRTGQTVTVTQGPYKGLAATVVLYSPTGWVCLDIRLNEKGRRLAVELPESCLSPTNEP
jgi:transcription antitermination factor NusG